MVDTSKRSSEMEKSLEEAKKFKSKHQYYATFCTNLLSFSYGIATGWTSPCIPLLQSNETPLPSGPLTFEEVSWIGAILCIGGLIGNLVFGWLADILGRKMSLCLIAIPQIIGWLLLVIATNAYYIMAFRFLAGFAGGAIYVVLPLYVSEISEDHIRGTLGCLIVLITNYGVLFAYIIGTVLPYKLIPWVCMPISILFLIGFWRLPDTPAYLMAKNNQKEAEHSLKFYRKVKKSVECEFIKREMESLLNKTNLHKEEEKIKVSLKDFAPRSAKKGLIIGIGLMALNQCCGCFAMLNFTASIFAESGSSLSPNVSSIVVGFIQVFGDYFSYLLVDRMGRRFLLGISSFGTALGLYCLSGFSFYKYFYPDNTDFNWVPLVSFSFVIYIASWGVFTLPFLVLSEILPEKIRGFATTLCMTLFWIFATLVMKYLTTMLEAWGMHGMMCFFATNSFLGAVFLLVLLPETKGKSFDEIKALLEK